MSLVTPKLYPMVNLDGLDLAEVDGTRVPGIYDKIRINLPQENIEIFYNWYFADIILAPYRVVINTSTPNQYLINGVILVKSDDTVSITGHIYIPVIESLSVTENGTYNVPSGVDGFGPVVVDIPSVPPVLVELNATENGTYVPSTGQDGFSQVNVNVPDIPPVLTTLSVIENGIYTPEEGVDGFSSVTVDVEGSIPSLPPEYQEVEYMTFSGTQWFRWNSGYIGYKVIYTKSLIQLTSTSEMCVVGNGDVINERRPEIYYSGTSLYANQGTNLGIIYSSAKAAASSGAYTQNTIMQTESFYGSGYVQSGPDYLVVGRYGVTNTSYPFTGRIHKLGLYSTWEKEEFSSLLVPCYRKADNVPGFYDVITNTFYTNQGTGNLVPGPNIS